MSSDAQIAANRINAQASTGPRTAEGQSRVSQNAVSTGLYSSGDFVRPDEQDLYADFRAAFDTDLAPEGAMEQTLAAEIVHAAWRLRRCSIIESGITSGTELDPLLEQTQQSVDRARAQAQRSFHRATSELRRLQTERQFRIEFLPEDFDAVIGLASYKDIAPALTNDVQRKLLLLKLERVSHRAAVNALMREAESPITKQTQSAAPPVASIGRNAPCTCGSGIKFKRCCGKDAPAVLHHAA